MEDKLLYDWVFEKLRDDPSWEEDEAVRKDLADRFYGQLFRLTSNF